MVHIFVGANGNFFDSDQIIELSLSRGNTDDAVPEIRREGPGKDLLHQLSFIWLSAAERRERPISIRLSNAWLR